MLIYSDSLFDIVSVALEPEVTVPTNSWWIPRSAADAAAVYPSCIKILLTNGSITFFINGKPVFNKEPIIMMNITIMNQSTKKFS